MVCQTTVLMAKSSRNPWFTCTYCTRTPCFGRGNYGSNAISAVNQQVPLTGLGIGVSGSNVQRRWAHLVHWLVQPNGMNRDVPSAHDASLVGYVLPLQFYGSVLVRTYWAHAVKLMPYMPPAVTCRTTTVFPGQVVSRERFQDDTKRGHVLGYFCFYQTKIS
jgi:hypothetical protein